jgi:hypothetical protein
MPPHPGPVRELDHDRSHLLLRLLLDHASLLRGFDPQMRGGPWRKWKRKKEEDEEGAEEEEEKEAAADGKGGR